MSPRGIVLDGDLSEQEREDRMLRSAAEALDRALSSREQRALHLGTFIQDLSDLIVLKLRPSFRAISIKVEEEDKHIEQVVEELGAGRRRPDKTVRALEAFQQAGRVRGDMAAGFLVENRVVGEPFQARRLVEILVRSRRLRWDGDYLELTAEGRHLISGGHEERTREEMHHEPEQREDEEQREERPAGQAQRRLFDATD